MKKNKLNEDTLSSSQDKKTNVTLNKKDLGDPSVQTNLQKLGQNVNVTVVDEDVTKKTISDVKLHKLAQKAGNFGEDVKQSLINLIMIGKEIPMHMVVKTLANYDLKLADLKGQDGTFKPSPEFAHLFNSSLEETENQNNVIKYLSNVKDPKSGEVSKPFTIGEKRYQMVRGKDSNKQVVMGVYCHDDINENGENIIHPIEHFESNIARPMLEKEKAQTPIEEDGYDYSAEERGYHDKEAFIDYLNLRDLEGYKHFFVDIKSGKVTGKFQTTREMMKSGQKLGPNEDYMDARTLKKFRFGDYFKNDINETEETTSGTDLNKLQSDVKKLSKLIKDKFSVALSKLDKPIEQVQFLQSMANEIGVPMNKLSTLLSSFKDIATTGFEDKPAIAESKKMTKNQLIESLKKENGK
jgi:hypothetical protein